MIPPSSVATASRSTPIGVYVRFAGLPSGRRGGFPGVSAGATCGRTNTLGVRYPNRRRAGGPGGVMINAPSASYSVTVRLEIENKPGMLGKVTSAIGKASGDIGAIDLVEVGKTTITRDLSFKASDERHAHQVVEKIE